MNQSAWTACRRRASYAQLESSLGPNHPQAKALKAQIDELEKEIDAEQNRLLIQAKQNYVVARANEDQTTAALEAQKADAYKLRDQLVEYTLRQREFEANRTLYDSLQQRLRTASVQSGLESLEIDVVDPALPPANPVLRPQSTVILTALVFSLAGGHRGGLPDGEPGYRIAEHRGDREHHGAAIAGHHSASATVFRRSGRDPDDGADGISAY